MKTRCPKQFELRSELSCFLVVVIGTIYLSCHNYVAAKKFKNIKYVPIYGLHLTLLMLPCRITVYSELCSKKDSFFLAAVTPPYMLWMLVNVVNVYALLYYNTLLLPLLISFTQAILYVLLMAALIRWVQLIQRQNRGRFQNTEVYIFL